jgi:hypothetical protein
LKVERLPNGGNLARIFLGCVSLVIVKQKDGRLKSRATKLKFGIQSVAKAGMEELSSERLAEEYGLKRP